MQPIVSRVNLRKPVQTVKIVTIGDTNVGKTCLNMRFVRGDFDESYKGTIGEVVGGAAASFLSKTVETPDQTVVFHVWDTAGQERFKSLVPLYFRDAKAAIIVYDVTYHESFENVQTYWLPCLCRNAPEDIRVALVGNKLDLRERQSVVTTEARKFAEDHNFLFIETSAKSGENVDQLFFDVAHLLGDSIEENVFPEHPAVSMSKDDVIYPAATPLKKHCC